MKMRSVLCTSSRVALGLAGALALAAACNPYSPDLPDRPFRCGTDDPRCPEGYECVPHIIEAGQVVEAYCERAGADVTPLVDAAPAAPDADPFKCNNDGEIEPNDSLDVATPTRIPDFGSAYELFGLAVCPPTDVDLFRIEIEEVNSDIRAEIKFLFERGGLEVRILNASGMPVGSEPQVVDTDTGHLRTEFQGALTTGVYYIRVQTAAIGIQNNYQLLIETFTP